MLCSASTESSGRHVAVENSRPPSPRPSVVVDDHSGILGDSAGAAIGMDRPYGRERVLFALPLEPGPALLEATVTVGLVDTDGNPVGLQPVWVSRMATARWVEDTRRLSG